MRKYLMEVCCGSVEDVLAAKQGGADRVELNSCLFHGGLTPSVGELIVAKQMVDIPVMTMVRPRQGGFCYTEAEFRTAMADAEQLLAYGSDGLVFGFLHEDGTLDVERCRQLIALAGDREKVFHRAIDVAADWKQMLGQLIDLGVTRVLTSGLEPDVFYGIDTIHEMVEFAQGRIQILHLDGPCNRCGNCETFCPWSSAPYRDKWTLFPDEACFHEAENPGFAPLGGARVLIRFGGQEFEADLGEGNGGLPEALAVFTRTVLMRYPELLSI